MSAGGPVRVLVLTNILPPYRVPLYQRLASMPGLDVRVILLGESEPNRQWDLDIKKNDFATQVLPGKSLYFWRWELPVHLKRGLVRALEEQSPDVVLVSGWDQPGYWQAAWWCKRRGVPLVLHCGSTLTSGLHTRTPWMLLRKAMVRMASTYVAYGSRAREHLCYLGAPPERVHVGFNTVDMDAFAAAVQQERARPATRQLRGSYPPVLLLYTGQLISRKRVDLALGAMASLDKEDLGLLVVGSGPEEAGLRSLAASLGLRHVYFEGFRQPDELPRYYALADVLVLPSDREVWGLVVNEALAAGLYCICSDKVGAACDALRPGWNGDTFAAGDAQDLAARLRACMAISRQVAERRDAIVADARARLGIGQMAEAFAAAVRQAVGSREAAPSLSAGGRQR